MQIKRTVIITFIAVVVASVALVAFVKFSSENNNNELNFAEVKRGSFEIVVSNTGELTAERSVLIKGPNIVRNQYFRAVALKVTDLVPEGKEVRQGDYIGTLDRTDFSNILKTEITNLKTIEADYEMRLLDTAVILSTLRDDIKNQIFAVKEAEIIVEQSKFEPPATQRKTELDLERARRNLEQKNRSYFLRLAQTSADSRNVRNDMERQRRKVNDLDELLASFTIKAPADGLVIYAKDRMGVRVKTGSVLNPWDPVVAALPDLSSMISTTYVSEIDVNKIKPGLRVRVTVDALKGKAFTGRVTSIANIGEQLANSDSKLFEVLVTFDNLDQAFRPMMTTNNEVVIRTFNDVVYVPIESLQTGADNIPFVYTKDKVKQIVIPGAMNDKFIVIEKGLAEGTSVFLTKPLNSEKFKVEGQSLISEIIQRKEDQEARNQNQVKVIAEDINDSDSSESETTSVSPKGQR